MAGATIAPAPIRPLDFRIMEQCICMLELPKRIGSGLRYAIGG